MFRDSRRVRQLLLLAILTSITLITIDYRSGDTSPFRGLRSAAGTVFGPIERGVSSALRPVGNALSTLGNVRHLDKEVKTLRAERAGVQRQQRTNEDTQRRYGEAGDLLKIIEKGQYRTIPANVIGAAPSNFSWTVSVDAGSDRGVRKDQTVINADGLVGRVIEVSKFTSKVLLAIDLESTVGGRLAYTGEQGFVEGRGPKELRFEVAPATAEVAIGQPVLTAGSAYVAGIPIGKVVSTRAAPGAASRSVVLEPYVDFSHLDLVGIVVSKERRTDPDALVPPNPRPSATVPAVPTCRKPSPTTSSTSGSPDGTADSSASSPVAPTPTTGWAPCMSSEPPLTSTPSPAPTP